ncbi:hypothetical protein DFJ58DRAFT_836002 [Suillus subalutaceus]|uniref:uncharacterized protein n=1 Tax=Suillus subalutaceus TaxID=48586 RepID=UPI001B86FA50|nr:uncharacterized protein DFJ58DRAFT_836002 [Suillus subalutaceus]KAG1876719.1 hypothetical protein DFJ58DRAFT_836002 [Suillus subalutaceus]
MVHCGPKSWATVEEDAFLKALLPEYIRARHWKMYDNFWTNTFQSFFHQWPERMHLHHDGIPTEGDLTPHEKDIVRLAIKQRRVVIKHWFRWQTNTAHLAHSGKSRSVLNLDDTLSREMDGLRGSRAPQEVEIYSQYHYDTCVKAAANSAITAGGIYSRGDKLSKRKEITRITYAKEGDSIRTKVKQKHKEVLAKWKQDHELAKAGAFNELGSHLDHVFRHLSHKMGGLKFTCIAGGRNPSTGEVVVVDFHLGETDTGADFSACSGFSDVQVAYADFMKEAVAHNDNMQSLVNEEASAQAPVFNKDVDERTYEYSSKDGDDEDGQDASMVQQTYEGSKEDGDICGDKDGRDATIGLYHIPREDFSVGLQGYDLDPEWFNIDHLHTKSDALLSEESDPSVLGMDFTNMIAALSVPNTTNQDGGTCPPSQTDASFEHPATASAPDELGSVEVPDYYELAQFFQSLDLLNDNGVLLQSTIPHLLPPAAALHDELLHLPAVPDARAASPLPQSAAPQMLSPRLPNGTTSNITTGPALSTSGRLNPLTTNSEQPNGPHRTACRHIPSTREQALNAIGSSKAHVCAMEGKENEGTTFPSMKRKAKPTNEQVNNCKVKTYGPLENRSAVST